MNILKKFTFGIRSNLALAIIAVIIAIITWFYISMTLYPSITNTYENIAVNIDAASNAVAESGLSIISCDTETVNVRLRGSRMQMGNLSSGDFTAKLNTNSVTAAGKRTLDIEILCNDPDIDFVVESISPKNAVVVFDKFETRKFNVVPEIPNFTFGEGQTIDSDEFICEPDTVNITGPSAQLDKIDKVAAVSNKNLKLDSSYNVTNDEIKLYTEDGTTIDQSAFKFDTGSFMINVPVLTQKKVDLSVGISGAPSNFNIKSLKFKLSAESITLASKTAQLSDFPNTFEAATIPLNELDLEYSKSFTIDTGNYKNMSNLDSVTVTLDDSNLSKKNFTISEFKLINAPENYDFDVVTQNLDVSIIGPSDVIEEITSGDIVANINLMNIDKSTEGETFNIDITVTLPKYNNVWAVTHSKVVFKPTVKTTESASGTQEEEN